MRNLNEFSAIEWLKLDPLGQSLRQVRNDLLLSFYKQKKPAGLGAFLGRHRNLNGKDVALVIAFEQPWALDWLLEMAARNLPGVTVMVFDNSRTPAAREEIAAVCARHGAPYLGLPPYRTRHVNRSHGMAMSWVFYNVVRPIAPRLFAFIDHDLIPVDKVDFNGRLGGQKSYGLINPGVGGYWSTWAGYCVFRYAEVAGRPLNFLYDFSRGLDTGGRNWNPLYSRLDRSAMRFATQAFTDVQLPNAERRKVEVVDDAWIHIGGISYNDNFADKFDFFKVLRATLDAGADWKALLRP